jgi:hypothetical protein
VCLFFWLFWFLVGLWGCVFCCLVFVENVSCFFGVVVGLGVLLFCLLGFVGGEL